METRLYTVLGIEANLQFNDDDEYTCIKTRRNNSCLYLKSKESINKSNQKIYKIVIKKTENEWPELIKNINKLNKAGIRVININKNGLFAVTNNKKLMAITKSTGWELTQLENNKDNDFINKIIKVNTDGHRFWILTDDGCVWFYGDNTKFKHSCISKTLVTEFTVEPLWKKDVVDILLYPGKKFSKMIIKSKGKPDFIINNYCRICQSKKAFCYFKNKKHWMQFEKNYNLQHIKSKFFCTKCAIDNNIRKYEDEQINILINRFLFLGTFINRYDIPLNICLCNIDLKTCIEFEPQRMVNDACCNKHNDTFKENLIKEVKNMMINLYERRYFCDKSLKNYLYLNDAKKISSFILERTGINSLNYEI